MARGSIGHIALTVSDLERSTAFYNKVFNSWLQTLKNPGIHSADHEDTFEPVAGRSRLLNIDNTIKRQFCAQGTRSKRSWI